MALVMGPLLGRIASMVVIFSLVTKITQTPLHQHVTRGNDYLLLEKRVCLNSYFNTVYNSCLFISLINLHFMQISHSTFFLQTHNSFQSSFFFLTLYLFTCCSLHFYNFYIVSYLISISFQRTLYFSAILCLFTFEFDLLSKSFTLQVFFLKLMEVLL